jgi:hypothetical protein
MAIIDILQAGGGTQCGGAQTGLQTAVVALGALGIEQEAEVHSTDCKGPDPGRDPLPAGSTPRADSLLWPALAREAKTPPEPGASDG